MQVYFPIYSINRISYDYNIAKNCANHAEAGSSNLHCLHIRMQIALAIQVHIRNICNLDVLGSCRSLHCTEKQNPRMYRRAQALHCSVICQARIVNYVGGL